MDLCERSHTDSTARHPWELARVQAIRQIVRKLSPPPHRVLDMGCGDGYTAQSVFTDHPLEELAGLDIHLSEEQIQEFSRLYPSTTYANNPDALQAQSYDLILLLDVAEHVEDDTSFLRDTVERFLAPGGHVLLTVPAFQSLYSQHDVYLKHYRRYNRTQLKQLVQRVGLTPVQSGYLFGSLLFPRFLTASLEKLSPPKPQAGVGQWNRGEILTRLITGALNADNRLLLSLNQWGLTLPGLTSWTLCKPSQS